tara:strand:+ start:20531 stop:20731 length:201 start_codon:yes stop_codon:yes gene_type:complete
MIKTVKNDSVKKPNKKSILAIQEGKQINCMRGVAYYKSKGSSEFKPMFDGEEIKFSWHTESNEDGL